MQINLVQAIQGFIVFQGLFLIIFLSQSNKRRKKQSTRLMMALLGLLTLHMLNNLLVYYGAGKIFGRLTCFYGYLYGPLFYGQMQSLMYKDFRLTLKHSWHAIPAIFWLVISLSNVSLCHQWSMLILVSIGAYLTVSIWQVMLYRKVIKNTRTNTQRFDLSWMQLLIFIFVAIFLADTWGAFNKNTEIITFLLLLSFVNIVVYKGLQHSQAFGGITQQEQQSVVSKPMVPSDNEANQHTLAKLNAYVNNEQVYLNSNITLQILAEKTAIPARQISYLINRYQQQNFSEFINNFRIEAAKTRLKNPDDNKETILEVMYAVGFNSKSSFNTFFKKKTGLTPTEYKRKFGGNC